MEHPAENRSRRQGRLSVGLGLFLMCLVLTAVVGLFGGLMISNYTHNNYVLYAERADTAPVQRELAQAPAAAPEAKTDDASDAGDDASATAGTVSAFR